MATPLHATGMMVVVPVLVFSDNCHRQDLSLALGWPESPTAVLDSPGDAAIMPTRSKSPAAVSATSSKTIQLLRKRLRQLLHVTLVLAIGLALAATALAIWCLTSLNGLPDIGGPFDVAAFRDFSILEDRNAFVFFGRANEKRSSFPLWVDGEASSATAAWSESDPKVRAWVEPDRPVTRWARYLGAGYPPPGRRARAHRPSLERRSPSR